MRPEEGETGLNLFADEDLKPDLKTPLCLLLDNGSLRPDPTLHLRTIATSLHGELGVQVQPVSLLHSSGVDPALLDGQPAQLLEPTLRNHLQAGLQDFVILPQFFGPSRAITEYLPDRIAKTLVQFPHASIRLAECLFNPRDDSGRLLAEVLLDRLHEVLEETAFVKPMVALVDHGTPVPEVNQARQMIAGHLRDLLANSVRSVEPCSMERREGPEYDFNEPLLKSLLQQPSFQDDVIVSLLFFSDGRHAGPGGDIEAICKASPADSVVPTRPIGTHHHLVQLLARRFQEALSLATTSPT